MLIDWFTVIAQIVNFLVLIFLLQRFLYGPIVRIMDEREQQIAERLAAAERKQTVAEREAQAYRQNRMELAEQRQQMLVEAEAEAEARRKELFRQARAEADEARRRWHEAIRQEKATFLRELRRRTGEQVYTVARRALADLADADLEQQMVGVFVQQLRELDGRVRQEIDQSTSRGNTPVVVYSAFDLPLPARRAIQDALQQVVDREHTVRFETDPHLIAGIELRAPNHRVAWHLEDYLSRLVDTIAQTLETETRENDERQQTASPIPSGPLRGL